MIVSLATTRTNGRTKRFCISRIDFECYFLYPHEYEHHLQFNQDQILSDHFGTVGVKVSSIWLLSLVL